MKEVRGVMLFLERRFHVFSRLCCVVFVCRVFQGLTEQPRYVAECGGASGGWGDLIVDLDGTDNEREIHVSSIKVPC